VKLITIDGNIGSGKSTAMEAARKRYAGNESVVFAEEPVSQWQTITDKKGATILEKFYLDQTAYGFSFQMMAYISRLSILRKIMRDAVTKGKNLIIISERSLLTDKMIFARMLYDQGCIEEVDYQIYLTWFDEFANDFPINHCIYIHTDPSICYERIHERARTGEEQIPLSYLEQCHRYHTEYVKPLPCLTLDGNENIKKKPVVMEQWMTHIDQLIQTYAS